MSNSTNNPNDPPKIIDAGQVANGGNQPKLEDGGSVKDVSEETPNIREKVAGKLALNLVYVFAGALALHYAVFLALALTGKEESADMLSDFLNVWLPALTGIVSAAAAYYFSKER